MDEQDNLEADLLEEVESLIEETEDDLGRPLDDEERDSLVDEFLAGLEEEDEEEEGVIPLEPTEVGNVSGQPRSQVTGWFKRYGSGTGKGPVHEAAQLGSLVITTEDRESGRWLAIQAQAGVERPLCIVDEGKWKKAQEGASSTGTLTGTSYWNAVAAIYRNLGGEYDWSKMSPAEGYGVGNSDSVVNDVTPEKACEILRDGTVHGEALSEAQRGLFGARCGEISGNTTLDGEEKAMAATMNKSQKAKWLAQNCRVWKGTPNGEKVLNGLEEKILDGLISNSKLAGKYVVVFNKAKEKLNQEEGEVAGVSLVDLASLFGVEADPGVDPAGYMEQLRAKVTEVLDRLGGPTSTPAEAPPEEEGVTMQFEDETEEERKKREDAKSEGSGHSQMVGDSARNSKKGGKVVTVPKKQTMKEFLANMPEEARGVWNSAVEITNKEKVSLVRRLLVNVKDEEKRKSLGKKYMLLDVSELRERISLLGNSGGQGGVLDPTDPPDPFAEESKGRFDVAGGGFTGNEETEEFTGNSGHDSDLLVMPTVNHAENAKARREAYSR